MRYSYESSQLYYEIIGTGKPIIILHGLECDHQQMKFCMEPIFQHMTGYKRIYIDLPGMGSSHAPISYASSDKILEILLSFIHDLIVENFLLIGESYGGYLARGILSSRLDKVDGMMLLCPVIIPEHQKRNVPAHAVRCKDTAFIDTLSAKEKNSFCSYAVIANKQTYARYTREILPGLKKADKSFIQQLEHAYSFSFDVDNAISYYNQPVLFLCGRQDACVGYHDAWKLLECYPKAAFSVLDCAGHNLQIEQPKIFQCLVENWLTRCQLQ